MRFLAPSVLLVLLGAAAYEAAVALEWIPVGAQPGEGARYEGAVLVAAVFAMLAGIVLSIVLAARGETRASAALVAAASSALMIVHYFTFDTYYLPSHTRYSDTAAFSPRWVYSVAVAGGLASLFALLRPRIGFTASAIVIPICLVTIVFAGFGH
jgi:hypothetical protein